MAACVEVWKKSDCISHNLSLVLLQQQQSASKQSAVEAAFLSLLMLLWCQCLNTSRIRGHNSEELLFKKPGQQLLCGVSEEVVRLVVVQIRQRGSVRVGIFGN